MGGTTESGGDVVVNESGSALREPIAASWRRAALAGLAPSTAGAEIAYGEVDADGPLLAAALPILEDLDTRLADTGMCTVLVNRGGLVMHRWCGDRSARAILDTTGIDRGASVLEETLGTNAAGTALETRSSIVIHAEEHFAERLRAMSCYGQPIFHPTTRRIEGVLDISVLAPEANPLVVPLITKAVADIEQHLLEGSRVSERVLLAAFQSASRRHRPVVAIGDDIQLSNQAAGDLLDSSDLALLRNLSAEISAQEATLEITLRSGERALVNARRVSGGRGGILLQVTPPSGPESRAGKALPRQRSAPRRVTAGHVHVCGQSGTGRTTAARLHATQEPVTELRGGDARLQGSAAWSEKFVAAIGAREGTLCVDDVDLLPPELLGLIDAHARSRRAPHLVLATAAAESLSGPVRALTALCATTIELLPLAHRAEEIPRLAETLLAELGHHDLHLAPGALRALGAYHWPGNLAELRAVLDQAARRRARGAIVVEDLPAHLSADQPHRDLATLERAERDAVIAALRACDGNKVQAARQLGISRTTLYAKMRSLRIQTY